MFETATVAGVGERDLSLAVDDEHSGQTFNTIAGRDLFVPVQQDRRGESLPCPGADSRIRFALVDEENSHTSASVCAIHRLQRGQRHPARGTPRRPEIEDYDLAAELR